MDYFYYYYNNHFLSEKWYYIFLVEKINGKEFHNSSAFSLEEIFHLEESDSIVESLEYLENNSFQIEEKIFLIPYIINSYFISL